MPCSNAKLFCLSLYSSSIDVRRFSFQSNNANIWAEFDGSHIWLRLHTLEYYENRTEFAKFISLDSVASIECQNVSFESNGSTLRVRRLGQKTWYRELFKIRYFSQILLRHFLLKLYSVDISSNDKMKLAFEKHRECSASCTWQNWSCQTHHIVTSFYHWLCWQLFSFQHHKYQNCLNRFHC